MVIDHTYFQVYVSSHLCGDPWSSRRVTCGWSCGRRDAETSTKSGAWTKAGGCRREWSDDGRWHCRDAASDVEADFGGQDPQVPAARGVRGYRMPRSFHGDHQHDAAP